MDEKVNNPAVAAIALALGVSAAHPDSWEYYSRHTPVKPPEANGEAFLTQEEKRLLKTIRKNKGNHAE